MHDWDTSGAAPSNSRHAYFKALKNERPASLQAVEWLRGQELKLPSGYEADLAPIHTLLNKYLQRLPISKPI
jgi:hypothetical protein